MCLVELARELNQIGWNFIMEPMGTPGVDTD